MHFNVTFTSTLLVLLRRKAEILPVPCQYILSLMLFIRDNPNNFQTGLEIQKVKINFSFHLQTSQVFKKELPIMVLKYITVFPAIF